MLRKSSVSIAAAYAKALSDEKITLMPKNNTILNNLTSISFPITTNSNSGPEDDIGTLIEMYTTGTLDTPTEHDKESDAIINTLSKLTSQHISFAKNTVKPIVVQLAEILEEYNQNNKNLDPSSKFNIDLLELPEVLQNEIFLNSISYARNRTAQIPDSYIYLKSKTHEEILSLMLTGSEIVNKLIAEWISNNKELPMMIWDSFFNSDVKISKAINFQTLLNLDAYTQANYELCLYLISSGLHDTVQEEINLSLSEYKSAVTEYIDFAVRSLAASLIKVNTLNKTNILVLGSDKRNNIIKVNKALYDNWVKTNEPELLLGMLVSGEITFSIPMIEEKKDKFKQQWNSYCSFYKANESEKQYIYFKEFLEIKFFELLKDITEAEQEYINSNSNYLITVNRLLKEELAKIFASDISDVYKVALNIICKCRFFYTSSFNILNDINEASKVNKDIDVREAALIAAINYVSDYLSDQISISK